jgi:hypothetical protein
MIGNLFTVQWHFHGTLSADAVIRYKLPCDATLIQVDTNGTANVTSALIVGTAADTDGYIKTHVPGANATAVTKDRGDFDGALNPNTAECPHIVKDTVLLLTYTHASASDVDIALTFTEG